MATLTKGQNIRGILGTVARLEGPLAHARVVGSLGGGFGEALRYGGIVASGWYAVDWYRAMHDAIGDVLEKDLAYHFTLGREATREDFGSGVHRFFTSLVSPQMVCAQAGRLMSLYHKGGRVTVDCEKHVGLARYDGWDGFSARIWQDLIGGTVALLESTGVRDVGHRILSGGRGATMELELTWGDKP